MANAQTQVKIPRLAIIGIGLIGGSLALAAKKAGIVGEVIASGRSMNTPDRAVELGVADRAVPLPVLVSELSAGDVILVATPVNAMTAIFTELKRQNLPDDIILTDAGSTKGSVVEAAKQVWSHCPANFVPGHPIAGSEQSGVEAANADLYRQHRVILTPLANTNQAALAVVKTLWCSAQADVDEMSVEHHDQVLAATSHLPHVLSFALVDSLVTLEQNTEIFRYAAGGFRDFTRIAESDPVMWRDISLSNKTEILHQIAHFEEHLNTFKNAIHNDDASTIQTYIERVRCARREFTKNNCQ